MRHIKRGILATLLGTILLMGSCGGESVGGTETGNTVGAAVIAIFSNQEQTAARGEKAFLPARLIALVVSEAKAANEGPSSVCEMAEQATSDIEVSSSIQAGTYGIPNSPGNFVTLAKSDGCDQGGVYAMFTVASHDMTCIDGNNNESMLTMTDSIGVFMEEEGTEIYGTFTMTSGGSTANDVRCHITITNSAENESEFAAVCTDSEGKSIDQTTDTICTDSK